jgi:hypothetical protein
MSKKLTALTAAMLASLALVAIPAVASANVELYEGATKLAVGTAIKTNVPLSGAPVKFVKESGAEIFSCGDARFDGTVASNGPWTFKINVSSAKFTTGGGVCGSGLNQNTVSLTAPLCWEHSVSPSWELYSGVCGGAGGNPQLTIVNNVLGTCGYKAENASLRLVHLSLDPIKLKAENYTWFQPTSGKCWGKIGIWIPELAVTNSSGGSLKEIHT